MKKRAVVGVVVAMVAFITLGSVAFAKGGFGGYGMGGGMGMGAGMWCNTYNPNLTQEQRDKLSSLRDAQLKEVTPIQNQLFTKKLELRNLWTQANPDQEKILQKQREITQLQQQLQEKGTKYRLECNTVLAGDGK